MRFIILLDTIAESESVDLYNSIAYADADVLFTEFGCYVYGLANNFVLADILNQCHRYSDSLKITIEKDPEV